MIHDTTIPAISASLTPKQITRFWSLVVKHPEGCWDWLGAKLDDGYGVIHFDGRTYKAHRIAWYLNNGQIEPGHLICHTCDNPQCIRPDHLFSGTPKDNHDDMKAKGRGLAGDRHWKRSDQWKQGEQHHNAKLTDDMVREIRRRFVRRAPYRTNAAEIAKDLGITAPLVIQVADRKSWTHIP